MATPNKQTKTNAPLLRAAKNFSAFVTVLFLGSAAITAVYFVSRGAAYAARDGNFLPLLAVIGTGSAVFVGWKIITSAKRAEN